MGNIHTHTKTLLGKNPNCKKHYETKPNSISLLLKDATIHYILIRWSHTRSWFRKLSSSLRLAIADAAVDIKILWCFRIRLIDRDEIFVIQLISIWWCVNSRQSTNEITPHGKPMSYYDAHRNDMCPSHVISHMSKVPHFSHVISHMSIILVNLAWTRGFGSGLETMPIMWHSKLLFSLFNLFSLNFFNCYLID